MKNYDILLVYDHPHMLKVIGWALEDKGCQVTTASIGDETIELLSKRHFDVVLTDLVSNPTEGISVLRKAKDVDSETMVILLACKETVTDNQPILPHEADEYVFTPCRIPKLWKRVANCLKRLELKRSNAPLESHGGESNKHVLNIIRTTVEKIKRPLVLTGETLELINRGAYGKMDEKVGTKLGELYNIVRGLNGTVEGLLKDVSKKTWKPEIYAKNTGVERGYCKSPLG